MIKIFDIIVRVNYDSKHVVMKKNYITIDFKRDFVYCMTEDFLYNQ